MKTNALHMVGAINEALRQEMTKDERVVVYGEDVGVDGGVFRVTDGLHAEFGDQRCFDSPLAESGIVGTAIGLAINGMRPVVEIQFSGFLFEAFAQIMCHAVRVRNRSRGRFSCPMVIRTPYSGGIKALEHHIESEEAYLAHLAGLKVVIPSTPFDAKGLLLAAIRDPDPVVFFEPKRLYRSFKQEVPEQDYIIPIGKAALVREGTDLTLIAYGAMIRECHEAAALAEKEGISCQIVDVRTISPIDRETIIAAVQSTGRAIIVQEAPKSFSVASEIMSFLYENLFQSLKAPIARVTGFDVVNPMARGEDLYLPNQSRVFQEIKKVMG